MRALRGKGKQGGRFRLALPATARVEVVAKGVPAGLGVKLVTRHSCAPTSCVTAPFVRTNFTACRSSAMHARRR